MKGNGGKKKILLIEDEDVRPNDAAVDQGANGSVLVVLGADDRVARRILHRPQRSAGGIAQVAELAAAGVGAVLVPYPHAVDDHQTHNAKFLVDAGIVKEKTAGKYLVELEKIGILKGIKVGREKLYINIKFFNLLKQ